MNRKEKKGKSSTAFGRGIKRAARWVAKMFGYKAENKFARGLWYVFATGAAIVALVFAIVFIIWIADGINDVRMSMKWHRMENAPTYLHSYGNEYVSSYIVFHDGYPGYLYDVKKGLRTTTSVQWICRSSDGDSLTCYSDGEKRGYFNRFTGEVAIPAQYQKAWIFSDGVACVFDKGALHFIDHKGRAVFDKEFPYSPLVDDYCFHDGLCSVLGENGRIGLIDKQGNWVVSPKYNGMIHDTKGFWLVQDSEWNYGLLDAEGRVLLPIKYDDITIHHEDSCIFVRRLDHLNQVLDFECNIINPCNFAEVVKMEYPTDEYDEDGVLKLATANCLVYRTVEWYFGLMDKNGNIITPPSYSSIEAIGPDRYHCEGPSGAVILDSKGNECGEKL